MNSLAKRIADLSPEKRRLLERVLARDGIDRVRSLVVPRPKGMMVCPTSFAQQRLWFVHQLAPESPTYNMAFLLRFRQKVPPVLMERCYQEVLRRHEILRTTFEVRDGQPVQVIHPVPDVHWDWPGHDLSRLPPEQREARLAELTEAEVGRPFDLVCGPLLRTTWGRLGDEEYFGLFTLHHIVTDQLSHTIFLREMVALYEAFSRGEPSPLPDLPVQYSDYAIWQRQWLQGKDLERLLSYWRDRLANLAPLELPTDRPRPVIQSFAGSWVPLSFSPDLTERLRAIGRQEGATLFMTLLAAFKVLLHRHASQDDVAVASPITGRTRPELEGLMGFFVNNLVLRTDLSGDPTFRELLRRVRQVATSAYEHQDLPFERLVEELQPPRDLSRNPFVQTAFILNREALSALNRPDLALGISEIKTPTAKMDLLVYLEEGSRGLHGFLEYKTALFDRSTIERLAGHFRVLLEGIVAAPNLSLSALPLLDPAEQRRVLEDFNATRAPWTEQRGLHQLVEDQARLRPDAPAILRGGEELSYAELNRRANRLAHYLLRLGVRRGDRVGLLLDRSPDLVVAVLGVLEAGAAYLPLDPAQPAARLALMIQDVGPALVLTRTDLRGALPEQPVRVVSLDESAADIALESADSPGVTVGPRDLAYVICTSGSLGRPKSVLVEHGGVGNLARAQAEAFAVGPDSRVLQFASPGFDASVSEFATTFHAGAALVLPERPEQLLPGAGLIDLLRGARVTVVTLPPSLLAALPDVELPDLRTLVTAGEACPAAVARRWAPGRRFLNAYGPTETTVCASMAIVSDGDHLPPIGRPMANVRVYVLDNHLKPCPVGVPGELYVGGAGVARGYLGAPALTAERFLPDPFTDEPGSRMYRTGDRGRWRADGQLEFLGRIDLQVKVRGYRIEPGEVESALVSHPAVAGAAVLAREDVPGDRRLVAYVVGRDGQALVGGDLRDFLKGKLPEYMIPSAFVVLPALPTTPSGKVDRQALPAPGNDRPDIGRDYVAPRTPLETLLAERLRVLLKLDRVGAEDNFFELGGDSIKGALLVNQLCKEFDEAVPVAALFGSPTVAGLAAYLQNAFPAAVARMLGQRTGIAERDLVEFRQLLRPLPPRRGEDAPGKNGRVVFVLAPPRSGTTLLRVMLGGHPALFSPPELELLSFNTLAERRAAFPGRDDYRLEGLVRAVREVKGCDAEEARDFVEGWEWEGWSSKRCYRLLQRWLGKRLLVDKTPSHALDPVVLRRAEEDFDAPLYIHLLRHPCGMINSFEEARFDQDFIRRPHSFGCRQLAELVWTVSQQNIVQFLTGIPASRQFRVKYEDLVARPEEEIRRLCDFLGLDFEPDMADPYRDTARRMTAGLWAEPRLLGDVTFLRHGGIVSARADRWRGQVHEDSLGSVTRRLAGKLGYAERTAASARPAEPAPSLESDVVLDPAIRGGAVSDEALTNPAHVLLTGATGYLGAFLLRDLLEQTRADVFCLARAADEPAARERIRKTLQSYGLWEESFGRRIVPLPGDLARPQFGLGTEQFARLTADVDAIFHNGAQVHFLQPYEALRPANVGGTHEVLRLATRGKLKPVHYISTIGVFDAWPATSPAREGDVPPARGLEGGYNQSKWVAERLVALAGQRGLPVVIYRPGRVAWHSRTGTGNRDDVLTGLVRLCIRTGKCPRLGDGPVIEDITPVDHVSAAIVRLSRRRTSLGRAFHLLNPRPADVRLILEAIRTFGYPVQEVSADEWEAELASQLLDRRAGPEAALLGALLAGGAGRPASASLRIECRQTAAELAALGLSCPEVTPALVHVFLSWCVRAGLVEEQARKSVSAPVLAGRKEIFCASGGMNGR
jgi:amino acid adenylation domain-containing protein/thioester reductase-like protein